MRAFTITSAELATCPKHILSVRHWRENGTCLCVPAETTDHDGAPTRVEWTHEWLIKHLSNGL